MKDIIEQLDTLKLARFEIRLRADEDTVLNALIGSALRGAFGHSLKSIACSMPHGDCGSCILSSACLYTNIFEPTSEKLRDAPRPFIFEPPIPPLTREISNGKTMKLGVEQNAQISFGLTIIGDAIEKLAYFIYAIELFARKGIGASRSRFSVADVWVRDLDGNRYRIYSPEMDFIEPHDDFVYTLKDWTLSRLNELNLLSSLKLKLLTPLRIRRKRHLLVEPAFADLFKQASLRLKFLTETYGDSIEYDYLSLLRKAEKVEVSSRNIWRHSFKRWTNRQRDKIPLDGLLGEIDFEGDRLSDFMPFMAIGEILHIGSSSSFGLGKYKVLA